MKIFDLDGPVYRIGTEITDALILTFFWVVFSLPIVTIGASTSALFYIYGKKARGEDAYIWRDFWKSFRQNIKQSIPITLLLGVLWASTYGYRFILEGYEGGAPALISGLALFFTLEVSIITVYVLAILSRFHMGVLNMFLTAFVLAHRHIASTAIILGAIIVLQYGSMVMPILLLLTPVLVASIASMPIQKIFTQHIQATQMAQGEPEEVVEEDEWEDETDEDDTDHDDSNGDDEEDKSFLKYI